MINNDIYKGSPQQYVAVDCVIFGYEDYQLKLLLMPRPIEPSIGGWSLMGGFCGDHESLETAAIRVLKKNTGLSNIYLEQVQAFSDVQRDPGGRVISVVFYALIPLYQQDIDKVQERGAHWFPVEQLPDLIFDHHDMVQMCLKKLQMRASYQLVGKELLPEQFTLTQLRKLYEAIFQRELDPGNFRKKVLSLNALERLNKKNTTESKKGAYLYKFKKEPDIQNNDRVLKINFNLL
ncbi:MAG: NUDIX domain-containing protein [Marinilabilia sp.]